MSTCTDLVHVPSTATVYDSASPVYRFLHRQWTRLRAVLAQKGLPAPLARYAYKGRHFVKPGESQNTRVRDAQGVDNGERVVWTPEPTLRQKIALARAQRARRRDLSRAWMHTGAFPVLEDSGWIMRHRQGERLAVYAEAMKP